MIVIILTKTPTSLRGDLTKWCQEIQTGVYVGNFSSRIRERLWERILRNIGNGEATLVYNTNNEIGYTFRTTRQDRDVVYYDGIPLMMHIVPEKTAVKHGFSKAAKYHRSKKFSKVNTKKVTSKILNQDFVSIDLETTGLYAEKDKIIAIGAVKRGDDNKLIEFYRLVNIKENIPDKITKLTGIDTSQIRKNGIQLKVAIKELKEFIGDKLIVGYNLPFDADFLMKGCRDTSQAELTNSMKDLMPIVKRTNIFLDNYKLETVLKEYGIEDKQKHNASSDAKATFELADQLNKNGNLKI